MIFNDPGHERSARYDAINKNMLMYRFGSVASAEGQKNFTMLRSAFKRWFSVCRFHKIRRMEKWGPQIDQEFSGLQPMPPTQNCTLAFFVSRVITEKIFVSRIVKIIPKYVG